MNEYPFELRKISLTEVKQQLVTFLESFHLNFDDDVQEAIGIFISAQNSKTESSHNLAKITDRLWAMFGHVIKCIVFEKNFRILAFFQKSFLFLFPNEEKRIQNILIYKNRTIRKIYQSRF
jgi:hypothetical protein